MKLHIIVQYYAETRDDRRDELHYCMRKNLADDRIECIHDLQTAVSPPQDILEHGKYKQVPYAEWLTYERALQYANEILCDQLVALTNLDIFLSQDFCLEKLKKMRRNVVLALARWEYDSTTTQMWLDPAFAKRDMAVSQDMWVFKPPIHVRNCNFKLGILGCDHAIAHRLRLSGYLPVNDCLRFRICHLDRCRGKCGADGLRYHQQRSEIQTYPGQEGRMLVPMLKDGFSLDAAAAQLGLGEFAKYRALLDLWNANLQVRSFAESGTEGDRNLPRDQQNVDVTGFGEKPQSVPRSDSRRDRA